MSRPLPDLRPEVPYFRPRRGRFMAIGAALACLAVPTTARAQDPDAAALRARIEAAQAPSAENELAAMTIEELMEHLGVPGVSIAVIHDFEVHWARGYGVADVETGAPVDVETMFQAASISKPVAAMGTLDAVEDGLFGLDDDINDILTSWTLDGGAFTATSPVTPRTLTSHTSGLGDAFGFPGYDPDAPLPTVVEILDGGERSNVRRVFMERAPYEAYEYSGGGVTVMQLALQDARGEPFAELMQHRVLDPIGMTRSSFRQPISAEHDRNAARAHDGEGRSRGPKWHVYPEMAAAGLWTTPTDLARFAIEVQKSVRGESNRVLSRETAREMIIPVGVGDFAVGFSLRKQGEGWYFQHGGSNWGFRATLLAHTVKGYGLAIMTNADRGGQAAAELSRRIQAAYEWDSMAPPVPRGYAPPPVRTEITLEAAVLARYVGTYLMEDEEISVTLEGSQLFVQPRGEARFPIFAESETDFFLEVIDAQLSFTHDADGEVDGVVVVQAGTRAVARRVR